MDPSVAEDLKLTSLISSEILPALLRPCSAEDIVARQQVFHALEASPALAEQFRALSRRIHQITALYEDLRDARCERESQVLTCCLVRETLHFCQEASSLSGQETAGAALLRRFADAMTEFCGSEEFRSALQDAETVCPKLKDLSQSTVRITGIILRMASAHEESYLENLLQAAETLGLGDLRPQPSAPRRIAPGLIEAEAKLHPDSFEAFAAFRARRQNFFSPGILRYRLELDFYLEILALTARIRSAGIPVCYPTVSDQPEIHVTAAYDITLLTKEEKNIIPNDIRFTKDERFFYLTGANGGGKTTYLRTVGVTVLLFLAGCPTPCEKANMQPLQKVFTHFPRDERFDLAGRFMDENNRVQQILQQADDRSLVLLNETYSTTAEEKALRYTSALAGDLWNRGSFGVYVTHHHAAAGNEDPDAPKIPLLSVLVDRSDSNRRTFKVALQRSIANSYAHDILEKYGLTAEALERRFCRP